VTGSFVSPALRARIRGWATPIALAFGRIGLTPNALTFIGFMGTLLAASAAARQSWALAGVLVIAFGVFDLFDGALARATGRTSAFGAFLDSTFDRLGENLVLAGIAVGCADAQIPAGVFVAVLAMALASVVTYTRAKAELVGLHGEVGLAPREVRLALLGMGLVIAGLTDVVAVFTAALGLIALLSAITIAQRIVHVMRQLDAQQRENQ
jgi:CDP-diacylglycerol--glycerol-3-phosphate 3-phosphatidyltransferase